MTRSTTSLSILNGVDVSPPSSQAHKIVPSPFSPSEEKIEPMFVWLVYVYVGVVPHPSTPNTGEQ